MPTPTSSFEDLGDFFLDGRPAAEDGDDVDEVMADEERELGPPDTRMSGVAVSSDYEASRGRKRLRVSPPTPPRTAIPVTVRRRGPSSVKPIGLLSRTRPADQTRTRALPGPTPQSSKPRRMVPGFEYAHSLFAFNEEARRRALAPSGHRKLPQTPASQLAAVRDQHPLPVYTNSDEELWAAVPDLPLQELGEMCDRMSGYSI